MHYWIYEVVNEHKWELYIVSRLRRGKRFLEISIRETTLTQVRIVFEETLDNIIWC